MSWATLGQGARPNTSQHCPCAPARVVVGAGNFDGSRCKCCPATQRRRKIDDKTGLHAAGPACAVSARKSGLMPVVPDKLS
jgi:hypothetical protein